MKDMILRDGNRLIVSGAVTIENVVKLTELGSAMLNREDWVIDMQQVTEVDSSAVSMLLEWQRAGRTDRMGKFNSPICQGH